MKLRTLLLPIFLLLVAGSSSYANNNFHFYYNQQRPGGEYANYDARDVDPCASECERDNRCQSFNYGNERRDCWLKHNTHPGVPNDTLISGVKER